jgi:hypothetical protein
MVEASPRHNDGVIFIIGKMAWDIYSNMAVSNIEMGR